MEYKAVQSLKALTGDKSHLRQWRQKLVSSLYTVRENYGNMLKYME